MKVKTRDKPTTHDQNIITASRDCPIPIRLYYVDNDDDIYNVINIIKGHYTYSVGSFVQAVERNGKYMLTLGGTNLFSHNSEN